VSKQEMTPEEVAAEVERLVQLHGPGTTSASAPTVPTGSAAERAEVERLAALHKVGAL